tara:strand:+ start:261 stop:386 length:126 start_codon:yes stop_codon:yes gene_type:complete
MNLKTLPFSHDVDLYPRKIFENKEVWEKYIYGLDEKDQGGK